VVIQVSKKNISSRNRGNDSIRNQIRRLRFDNGEMTQQQLADKAQVTRQTIIALEQGRYSPSLLLAFRIAKAFDVGVEDVFVYEAEKT
jgi:putative transcriptional regulator